MTAPLVTDAELEWFAERFLTFSPRPFSFAFWLGAVHASRQIDRHLLAYAARRNPWPAPPHHREGKEARRSP